MKRRKTAKSLLFGSLASILIIGTAFADDKTHEITTIMGAKTTQAWWKTLVHCGGTLEAIGFYRKINKHPNAENNLSNATLIGNWGVMRLMIDRKIDEKDAFPIASAQYISAKLFEQKSMETAFKEDRLSAHFDEEIAKCETYTNEYMRAFPELFK